MKKEALVVSLICLILIGAALGYLAEVTVQRVNNGSSTTSSTQFEGEPLVFVSAAPWEGMSPAAHSQPNEFNSSYGGYLGFSLTVRNVANKPVWYGDLCGTSLSLRVIPENVTVKVRNPYRLLLCPVTMEPIASQKNVTLFVPVNDPTLQKLVQRGAFTANLTLGWSWGIGSPCFEASSCSHHTTYLVNFTVS